jgi:hypothetical protein
MQIKYELRKKAKSDDLLELEWKRFRRERERVLVGHLKKRKEKSQQSHDHYSVSQNGFN